MSEKNDAKKDEAHEISLHPFHPLRPFEDIESKETTTQKGFLTKPQVYKKEEVDTKAITNSTTKTSKKKSTVLSAGLMMTDACLGTTIFTFAV